MNKITKIGLNALVAIALMFATTVVVAQKRVAVSAYNTATIGKSVDVEVPSNIYKLDKNSSVTKKTSSGAKLDVSVFPILLQAGDQVYFTTPSDTSTWSNPANWHLDPANPDCPDGGNICRVRLNEGQTLADFLTQNAGASYASMLQHPQIDRKP